MALFRAAYGDDYGMGDSDSEDDEEDQGNDITSRHDEREAHGWLTVGNAEIRESITFRSRLLALPEHATDQMDWSDNDTTSRHETEQDGRLAVENAEDSERRRSINFNDLFALPDLLIAQMEEWNEFVSARDMSSTTTAPIVEWKNQATRDISSSSPTIAQEDTSSSSICHCTICDDTVDCLDLSCTTGEHLYCVECFNHYAKNAFQPGGSYEQLQRSGMWGQTVQSQPGELSCAFFQDDCLCGSIPNSLMRKYFTDTVDQDWRLSIGRIAVAKTDQERFQTQKMQSLAWTKKSSIEVLVETVEEALSRGARGMCPDCGMRGGKDAECMHITCEFCSSKWCYCCGRRLDRGGVCSDDLCNTCDRVNCFLEFNPSYKQCIRLPNESPGLAALNGFHAQRMAYFVLQIKKDVPKWLWKELEQKYTHILTNVPTMGRTIEWDQIDHAILPLFGETKASQVLWKDEMNDCIAKLKEHLQSHLRRSNLNPIAKEFHPSALRHHPQPEYPPYFQIEDYTALFF